MENKQNTMEERFRQIGEGSVRFIATRDEVLAFLQSEIDLAVAEERKRIVEEIKELPAFTSCSDKTMGKVSDEAKVPMYGTNYLERETVLSLISKDNLQDKEN